MRDAAADARGFVEGRSRADLDTDRMLSLALTRSIEIIGEAANAIPDDLQAQHPEIPWRLIVGMRNRLVHGYYELDYDIVWMTTTVHLTPLIEAIDAWLASESNM